MHTILLENCNHHFGKIKFEHSKIFLLFSQSKDTPTFLTMPSRQYRTGNTTTLSFFSKIKLQILNRTTQKAVFYQFSNASFYFSTKTHR